MINRVASWFFQQRFSQIEKFMKEPAQAQKAVFDYLLQAAKNTEFGKKYGFADIKTPAQFAEQVPISTYEQLYPYIERCLKGEQNVLWHTKIDCFSKSSGTTNARSKYIPVSTESLQGCNYKAGKDMLAMYANNYPNTQIFTGKALSIGGSQSQNPWNEQTYVGDVSALLMQNLPFWAEYLRSPTLEIALMDKWEQKIEAIAKHSSKENITTLAGVPTWTISIIEKVLEITGKNNILDVWQNLECFYHGAVSFVPYRELFKKLIPSQKMNYLETYNASEGFFALQDQADSDDLLLLLDHGVYYEFVPAEDSESENPKAITLNEVELGKNYALIISTNAGLWRYKIGDTVKFTSISPYRIKISGRTKHFINAFGEEVIVENADYAIGQACLKTNAIITDFTAAPVYISENQKGGHEWLIEFEQQPSDFEAFKNILDESLRQINSDYDAKRYMDIALIAPKIHILPKGTFYGWLKKKNKLGGQHKVPRLSNHREYVEDILQMLS